MASLVLGSLLLLFSAFIEVTSGSPLISSANSRSHNLSVQLDSNFTSLSAPTHLKPQCYSKRSAYHPITRIGCSEGLRYLLNNNAPSPRMFARGSRVYTFPPWPALEATCVIEVYGNDDVVEATLDYIDIYLDAQSVIDECGVDNDSETGPWSGKVAMLETSDRERLHWNGFWVVVRAMQHK